MAATHASKEVVRLQRLCSKLGFKQQAVRIDCDNQSLIFLAKNPAYHSRTKHIDVQYHFVRDMVESMKVLLENVADSLTKSVSTEKFSMCRAAMGISALDCWFGKLFSQYAKKTTSGRMLGLCYILCMEFDPELD